LKFSARSTRKWQTQMYLKPNVFFPKIPSRFV
jgi:hypothetical protein